MRGRDPHEPHRASTPLELLFDLTFVIGFGVAAQQLGRLVAQGHVAAGLAGFSLAMFAVCWAWINFSWFASAFDVDDWIFRVVTMVQMVGVVVLALGLPRMFASIDHGLPLDNGVMVLGYVIMRIAMVVHWLRAAAGDPARRPACLAYALAITGAQVGWVSTLLIHPAGAAALGLTVGFVLLELSGPVFAERLSDGTPWHAHHIAERYGLLAIIAIGEGIVGATAAISAAVEAQGWSLDAALVAIAGLGLTFGMWWVYFLLPSAPVLHIHRSRSFVWGYGHMVLFASIAATGAGLQTASQFIAHQARIGPVTTVLAVAAPVGIYVLLVYGLYAWLVRKGDSLHIALLAGTLAVLLFSVNLATFGVDMAWCLAVLMLAPLVTVVGYETLGKRHASEAVARAAGQAAK